MQLCIDARSGFVRLCAEPSFGGAYQYVDSTFGDNKQQNPVRLGIRDSVLVSDWCYIAVPLHQFS